MHNATETPTELPGKLSPSKAKTYMQCPKRFYYEAILGLSTPETIATAKGTLAHHAFERIFDHARAERTLALALDYVEPAWRTMTDPLAERATVEAGSLEWTIREANKLFADQHPLDSKTRARHEQSAEGYKALFPEGRADLEKEFLDQAREAVKGWFSMENPTRFDPYERELYVMAEMAGCTVHGFIDRLDRVSTANGERWYVSDYKTGKRPKEQYEDEAFFQLAVYALLVKEMMGVDVHQLRLLYVQEGRPDAVLTRMVTTEMLASTRKKLAAVWSGMKRSAKTGEWVAKKSVLCGWCPFATVCPAHVEGLEALLPQEIAVRTGARVR